MSRYTAGLVDGIALLSVTILLLLAALFAGGCEPVEDEPCSCDLDCAPECREQPSGRADLVALAIAECVAESGLRCEGYSVCVEADQ